MLRQVGGDLWAPVDMGLQALPHLGALEPMACPSTQVDVPGCFLCVHHLCVGDAWEECCAHGRGGSAAEGIPKEAGGCQLMVSSPEARPPLEGITATHLRLPQSSLVLLRSPSSQGSLTGGDQTVITVSDRNPLRLLK